MQVLDAIAQTLKIEGIEYLYTFPTTHIIESAAELGIRPIICRQERVGVGIADGYARVKNGIPTQCPCCFCRWDIPVAEMGSSRISVRCAVSSL
jgi:hypothetical protein